MIAIKEVMTAAPYSINAEAHVLTAKKLMARHKIRHLPVVDGKKVVGVLSDRDLAVAEKSHHGRDFNQEVQIMDLCLFKPVLVDEDTPLAEVAATMARKKIGSVIVLRGGRLCGIFTAIDACRLLAELS